MKIDEEMKQMKLLFKNSKMRYQEVIEARRLSQKDLDQIKDRKQKSQFDIERITDLYRAQISLEQQEEEAKIKYKEDTDAFERVQEDYLSQIRERYIEEQMYSDKTRAVSTYWTWLLMSTHLTIFIVVQFVVEPRKKRDLKISLLEMVQQSSKENEAAMAIMLAKGLENVVMEPSIDLSEPELVVPVKTGARWVGFWNESSFWSFLNLVVVIVWGFSR